VRVKRAEKFIEFFPGGPWNAIVSVPHSATSDYGLRSLNAPHQAPIRIKLFSVPQFVKVCAAKPRKDICRLTNVSQGKEHKKAMDLELGKEREFVEMLQSHNIFCVFK
jgi:hypothetical protein